MPAVLLIPVPDCCQDKHRYAPANDASVEDVVFPALSANPVAILNLPWRERHWLE